MIEKFRTVYKDYPSQFWLLMAASFVDMAGGFLIFPFFSLYFTDRFDASLVQVGGIYAIWAFTGILGRTVGGALTDRTGRKTVVIVGLVFSATTSLLFAFVNRFELAYVVAVIGGVFSSISGPAYNAMTADLLPEDQLSEGYSLMRVIANAAYAIGPAIGGLLASASYILLFSIDALSSILTAVIIALFLKETQSQAAAEKTSQQSLIQVFRGYFEVLKDRILLSFIFLCVLVLPVYFQWYFSVPVFMRDVHGMPPYFYGSMMSLAGIFVVVAQLPITRKLRPYPPLPLMAVGSALLGVGFGMFGFASGYVLFALAFAVITFAEMIWFPTQQAVVARLAPEEMRGRYMAVASLAFALPNMFGPALGGYLFDHYDPYLFWYYGGLVCVVGAIGYAALHARQRENPLLATQ